MSKYKYYFKKPKSEIAKDILLFLRAAGTICVAATSPYFARALTQEIKRLLKKKYKYKNKKFSNAFYRLKKEDCIDIQIKNRQIYISLTEKRKQKANWMQINNLKIKKPKKWDGKWRLAIFDISQIKKSCREAFRGKLKELGFNPLQKSIWIHPFDCRDEIDLLKDFFGLSEKELRLVVSNDIGSENNLKKIFQLS